MSFARSTKISPGMRFGMLTVVRFESHKDKRNWVCVCDCGTETSLMPQHLLRIGRKSCHNCWLTKRQLHHGKTKTRLYRIWEGINERCNNPHRKEYPRYGGRGIKICNEWRDFSVFEQWAIASGYDENVPKGICTIDRINNDGNYCPENCRWVDMKVQASNRRTPKRNKNTKGE